MVPALCGIEVDRAALNPWLVAQGTDPAGEPTTLTKGSHTNTPGMNRGDADGGAVGDGVDGGYGEDGDDDDEDHGDDDEDDDCDDECVYRCSVVLRRSTIFRRKLQVQHALWTPASTT